MKKSNEGDSALSSFDVKNEKLIKRLNEYANATGKERDRLARELMSVFLEFIDLMNEPDDGVGVHPVLRGLCVDGIRDYANGGSFDLFVGGATSKNRAGRPNKKRRDHAIRLSVAMNIDDGSDVLAAATLTSEQLAVGDVDGLPVVTLTPAAVRSIWYAAPLALLDADDSKSEATPKNPLIETNDFEELKQICTQLLKAYETFPPQVLKVVVKLFGVSSDKIAKYKNAIKLIVEGSEPNNAFKYSRD